MRRVISLSLLVLTCLSIFSAGNLRWIRVYPVLESRGVNVVVSTKKKLKKTDFIFYLGKDTVFGRPVNDSTFFVKVRNMRRWTLTEPVVYDLRVVYGGDQESTVFGMRELGVKNGQLTVNGESFLMKGLVENALPQKAKMTEQEWMDFFRGIKKQGFNYISVPSYKLTRQMLTGADRCGLLVHTSITEAPTGKTAKSKSKKKPKKQDAGDEINLCPASYLYGEHPSLCMISYPLGSTYDRDPRQQEAMVFYPDTVSVKSYYADYSSMMKGAGLRLIDFSKTTASDKLDFSIKKALCTPEICGLQFAGTEQSKAYKDVMLLCKMDKGSWDSSDAMTGKVMISNNTDNDLTGNRISWYFEDENGTKFTPGHNGGMMIAPHSVSNGSYEIYSPMGNVFPGNIVSLHVKMDGTDHEETYSAKINFPAHILTMNNMINDRMMEWCMRLPGETDEEYNMRVNDVTKSRQKKLYANQIATEMAGDLMAGCEVKIGHYDKADGTLTLTMDNVPPVKLKVPESDLPTFTDGSDLEFSDVQYGLTNKDKYEIVYAKVLNRSTGAVYIYNNLDREFLDRLLIDDRYVPDSLKAMAETEDRELQVIKKKVIEEAYSNNLISDHTHINVNAHVTTDFDANGRAMNIYKLMFAYDVDASYSAIEDFAPGRYRIEQSHAGISMLNIIIKAFKNEFRRYVQPGKKLEITVTGSADASPIRGVIAYDGCYGDFVNQQYYLKEVDNHITVTKATGITQNEQLAYMRAQGVGDYMKRNLSIEGMDVRYLYNIELPKGTGGKFRRIKVTFSFIDAF